MAITHFTPQIISRGGGRSAVAAAAYRHSACMEHEAEGRVVDYSNKLGMVHDEFLLPEDAPDWARAMIAGRSVAEASGVFWNAVEAFEKRADAQLAKEFILALPIELTTEQNIALMRQFVAEQILPRGLVADWVYHDAEGNPHVHLMTTLRPLVEDGFGAKRVPVLAPDGQPVRSKDGKIVYALWAGSKTEFLEMREGWLALQNHHLAINGHEVRVDGRSYAERGIDIEPTTHIGVAARAIQRKAEKEGREAELERLRVFEAQRARSASKIAARPRTVIDMVSREKSVFDERDVAKIVHRFIGDADTFAFVMARAMQDPEIVRLEAERVDLKTGERMPSRYTTRELIAIEAGMVREATRLEARGGFAVPRHTLNQIRARHAHLSAEQRSALAHIAGKERIATVVGRAGAGKTTMMRAAREAWEAAGYRVVGAALAGKAAEGLEREAGIESQTLASWELRWGRGRDLLDDRTVMVMDEAGMVASRQMAKFVAAASSAGAKLVLIGDPEQLQPIEAGAAFRALVDRIGYAELENIYRQRHQWMRDASLDFARGRTAKALGAYGGHGHLKASPLKSDAIKALITDWDRDHDPNKSSLILAHLRRDVLTLNRMAREKLIERGVLEKGVPFHTEDGERMFAKGDQIVFLKNDSTLGVKNGMLGRVLEAGKGRVVAELGEEPSERRQVEILQRQYRNIDHGYATTIHKSQGATVDRVKVLASLSLDRHLTYVAMTRHREDVALYYGSRSFYVAGGIEKILGQRNAKETTLDYDRGELYPAALRYGTTRGLHAIRIARTLIADRHRWVARQKQHLDDLAARFALLGARLGLTSARPSTIEPRREPMVAGITTFAKSTGTAVEERVLADPGCKQQWEEVSDRFRNTYADPSAALHAMGFDAVIADPAHRQNVLDRLAQSPQAFGTLKGGTGLFASREDKAARTTAERNGPALRLEIERYLRLRGAAEARFTAEEEKTRARLRIDIPALSPAAAAVLEKVRDAIDRNDLPAALGYALSNKMVKLELDGFNAAIAERFGDRAFLGNKAQSPAGPAFEAMAGALRSAERERLAQAWPQLRAGQQLATHEKTAQAVGQRQAQEKSRSQTQSI